MKIPLLSLSIILPILLFTAGTGCSLFQPPEREDYVSEIEYREAVAKWNDHISALKAAQTEVKSKISEVTEKASQGDWIGAGLAVVAAISGGLGVYIKTRNAASDERKKRTEELVNAIISSTPAGKAGNASNNVIETVEAKTSA